MNIFVLDADPVVCASYRCDKHVVKMCIEYAQLLSTAARVIGYVHDGYASTHEKHPCTIWAADHIDNWSWLYRLAVALGDEYTHRYGKTHKSTDALRRLPYDLRYYAINRCSAPPTLSVLCRRSTPMKMMSWVCTVRTTATIRLGSPSGRSARRQDGSFLSAIVKLSDYYGKKGL